jgi:flavodoxin
MNDQLMSKKVSEVPMCLIIVYSYHHNNTLKVAKAMADVIQADVKRPSEVTTDDIFDYDIIGLGAGIDSGKHYKPLLDYADSLPESAQFKTFIFSTSGVQGDKKVDKDHKALRDILKSKGIEVLDEFSCKGFNTNSFLKYFGGINKNSPNAEDIENAMTFAQSIKQMHSTKGNTP